MLVVAGVDVNTQQSFEALNARAVAVVVDPIQSVKGKVVIDAFRSINPQMTMIGYEPRQTTSIIGHLNKPSIQALIHGLNRHYYSIAITYRKNELEEKMLMNLNKKGWTEGLKTADFKEHDKQNQDMVKNMLELAKAYNKAVQDEDEKTAEKFQIDQVSPLSRLYFCNVSLQPAQHFSKPHGLPSSRVSSKADVGFSSPHSPPPLFTTFFSFTLPLLPLFLLSLPSAGVQVGKLDAKKHLAEDIETVMSNNIIQCLGTMLDTVIF